MKPHLGGLALRGTLLAVLFVVAGALTIVSCGARATRPAPPVIAGSSTPEAAPPSTRPEAPPLSTVTSRDWRSIGGTVFTEDPDALLAFAEVQQLQVEPFDETALVSEVATAPSSTLPPREEAATPTSTTAPAPKIGPTPTTTAPPAPTTTTTIAPTTTTVPGGSASSSDEATFLSLINDTRAASGVAGLNRDGGLDGYARWWAEKMALAGEISHSGLGGIDASWTIKAENVGAGGTATMLYATMTGSSGHLANITDARFTHVGIGAWVDGYGKLWTVHVFAGR